MSTAALRKTMSVLFATTMVSSTLIVVLTQSAAVAAPPTITRTSVPDGTGAQANGMNFTGSASADGRYSVFQSAATNLVSSSQGPFPTYNVYLRDTITNQTTLISKNTDGKATGGQYPVITPNGRWILFSGGQNIVAGDATVYTDCVLYDRQVNSYELVSLNNSGQQANQNCEDAKLSPDARYVAFRTPSSNMGVSVPGDGLFLRDRMTSTTTFVNQRYNGTSSTRGVHGYDLSANGRFIVWATDDQMITPSNGAIQGLRDQVFMRDMQTGTNTEVSVENTNNDTNSFANNSSDYPSISADGTLVAFRSSASDLVTGDTNGFSDVFVRNMTTEQTSVITAVNGTFANGNSYQPKLSKDGSHIAFQTLSTNLAAGTVPTNPSIVIRDLTSTEFAWASPGTDGPPDHTVEVADISPDGGQVVLSSAATNLVPNDTNGVTDIFVSHVPPSAFHVSEAQTFGIGANDHAWATTMLRADPVNTATGSFTHFETDMKLNANIGIPFELDRTYNSKDTSIGLFGLGWSSVLDVNLTILGDTTTLQTEDGARLNFTEESGNTTLRPDAGILDTLTKTSGYDLVRPDQTTYHFDAQGRLINILDKYGKGLTLNRNISGDLESITDAVGRTVDLNLSGNRIIQATLPDGRHISYGYSSNTLTTVTDLRGDNKTYHYDGNNLLDKITDANGNDSVTNQYDPTTRRVTKQWDALGNLSQFSWDPNTETSTLTDAAGKTWTDVYSGNVLQSSTQPNGTATQSWNPTTGAPESATDANGKPWTATYDANGNTLQRTSPLSNHESWTYNAKNNPATYTNARGYQTGYDYDGSGRLSTINRPLGVTQQYSYNTLGLLDHTTDARGNTVNYTYDANGNRISQITATGAKTTWTYDATSRLTGMVTARGNVAGANPNQFKTTYTYDDSDNLKTVIDPLNHTTTYSYDNVGNLTDVKDAANRITHFDYNAANERTDMTEPDGAHTHWDYDVRGLTTSTTDARGKTTTYQYDNSGRMKSLVDPRGNEPSANPDDFRWMFEYDANGNQTSITNPNGHAKTFTYDDANRLLSETDENGHATTYGYDANGNLLITTDAKDGEVTSQYDELDRRTSTTDQRNHTTHYEYDANGNVTKSIDSLGNVTTFTYDADNRLASVIDPRVKTKPAAFTTTYTYDINGNLTLVTDPLKHKTTYSYDNADRLLSIKDALKHTTTYSYDNLNRLTSVKAPDGGVTSYGYDVGGNLNLQTDAKSHQTSWIFNPTHQVETMTSPVGTWQYAYDAAGNQQTVTAPGGLVTTNSYDALNRLTGINYSDSTPDISYGYDNVGNRITMTDATGTTTYGYDELDRLLSLTKGSDAFNYGYDPTGNVLSRSYPGGNTTNYTYDNNDRLSTLNGGGISATYGYDAANNVTAITRVVPGSPKTPIKETRAYDNAGKLKKIQVKKKSTTLLSETYSYDAGNNLSKLKRGSVTDTYKYDPNDRLSLICYNATKCSATAASIAYQYDLMGNRTSQTTTSGTTNYSYNAADQLTGLNGPGGNRSFVYDNRGNQTSDGQYSYAFDAANRITVATKLSTSAITNFTYDGDGNRTATQSNSGTINATWDVLNAVPQLATESGARTNSFIYGDYLLGTKNGSATTNLFTDRLGSVTAAADLTGAVVGTQTYEPFGSVQTHTGSLPTNLGYTGQQTDNGLSYLHARYYDASTGRLLSTDPVAHDLNAAAQSVYAYVDNKPTKLIDPTGMRGQNAGGNCKTITQTSGKPICLPTTWLYWSWSQKQAWIKENITSGIQLQSNWDIAKSGAGVGLDTFNTKFNPAYGMLANGDQCFNGEWSGTTFAGQKSYRCGMATADAIGTALTAVGGAGAISRSAATSRTAALVENPSADLSGSVLSKPSVTNDKLRNVVDDLYKGTVNPNRVGTGTTADAVRNELITGQPTGETFHVQKAQQYSRALQSILKQDLDYHDRVVAQSLLEDLKYALQSKP